MTILQAIEQRVSTRSFDRTALDASSLAALEQLLKDSMALPTPFGHKVRLALHLGDTSGAPARLGTYGLISGASAFLVAATAREPGAMEDLGYVVEKFVLEATRLGIASCWIGGVFDRSKSGAILNVSSHEIVPTVVALGRPAARRRLPDIIVTGSAKSRSRKALEAIALPSDGQLSSLDPSTLKALEAARWAPSASNKQPWRFIQSGQGSWVLCLDEDRLYNNSLGDAHMQNVDLGIVMRHFEEAARALFLPGAWLPATENPLEMETALSEARTRGWTPIAVWKV
jgi:nitroreductase